MLIKGGGVPTLRSDVAFLLHMGRMVGGVGAWVDAGQKVLNDRLNLFPWSVSM